MTFDEFKKDMKDFLEMSSVNLGRKDAKTKQQFVNQVIKMIDVFYKQARKPNREKREKTPRTSIEPESRVSNDRIMVLKPKSKSLDIGKGVHSMTQSESMRADEELNRSPFGNRTAEK
jgi:hypothetical protein